jgi:hypothetical protein
MLSKTTSTLILIITITISLFFLAGYTKGTDFTHNDGLGYYLYLSSGFIYHNQKTIEVLPLNKGIDENVLSHVGHMKDNKRSPKGYVIIQYTYGTALMELPFFLVAHAYEKVRGSEANGFSSSYRNLIKISTAFYAFLGLLLTYKTLRRYFIPIYSLLGVVLIFLGTNLFWFTLLQSGMSHIPLFFLYAVLVYFTIKVHDKPLLRYFLIIGFAAGIITITRPSDILCLLIPLLYNVYSRNTFKEKLVFIKTNKLKILAAGIAFIIPAIPQMIYWKALTGSFLYYSYADQTFNWTDPKIINGLFYFANGWLPYSPIMTFSILGMFLYRSIKNWAWCIWILFPAYVYVIYSWFGYNYIGGLGSRPMIHLYPLLAIPFTAFIGFAAQRKFVVKLIFSLLCLFFVALNYWYSINHATCKLESEEANMPFVMQTLFRTKLRYNDLVTYDNGIRQPDSSKLTKLGTLACENFDDSVSDHYVRDTARGNRYVYEMRNYQEYNPKAIRLKYNKQLFQGARWFKCSGRFKCSDVPEYYKHLFVLDVKRRDEFLLWTDCKIENKIGVADGSCKHDINLNHYELEKWGRVYYYARVPDSIKEGDLVELDVWNLAKKDLQLDDLCLELYK